MPDTNDNDIDALLDWCEFNAMDWHRALERLVAERGELKQRHAHLSQSYTMLARECDALKQRIAALESQPPASDLRERLVCAALTGILAHEGQDREFDCVMDDAIWMAGKALAAMRKGDTNAE